MLEDRPLSVNEVPWLGSPWKYRHHIDWGERFGAVPLRHGLQDETDPLRDKDSGVRVDEWFGTLYGLCACTSRPLAVMVFLVVAAERFDFPLFLFRLP
jgi:hypothetical protein